MKKIALFLLLALPLCTGCLTRRYTITLTNGDQISALGKPTFDKNGQAYIYKQLGSIPANLVVPPIQSAPGGSEVRYIITLTNGTRLGALTKPKLDKKDEVFKYKLLSSVSASRVFQIAPSSITPDNQPRFTPTPTPSR